MRVAVRLVLWGIALAMLWRSVGLEGPAAIGYAAFALLAAAVFVLWRHRRRATRAVRLRSVQRRG